VNSIKNGLEETDDAPHSGTPTSVTDEFHMEQVESVHERMRCISCTGIATEDGISPASVYLIITNSLGKQKSLCKVESTHAQ
jgi:hypothetical protein